MITLSITEQSRSDFSFFPNAIAAYSLPPNLGKDVSFLVWGVILLHPENYPELCRSLSSGIQEKLPIPLYLSGWGCLVFSQVCRGAATVVPYAPGLPITPFDVPGSREFLKDDTGAVVSLSREWHSNEIPAKGDYALDFVLEQPFGYMSIKLGLSGEIALQADPSNWVTIEQIRKHPELFSYDFTRARQLTELTSNDTNRSCQ